MFALLTEALHNLHNLYANSLLSLLGSGTDVGGAGDVGMVIEGLVGGGFVGIDVQTGGADLSGVEGLQQVRCLRGRC